MKRRTKVALLATALLVSVALIAVGFAGWVISGIKTDDVTGNVQAEAISDNTVAFTATVTSSTDGNVVFGAPKNTSSYDWGQNKDNKWLQNNKNAENLTVSFTLNFTSGKLTTLSVALNEITGTGTANTKKTESSSAVNSETPDGWSFEEAVARGYITNPTFSLPTSGNPAWLTKVENGVFSITADSNSDGHTIATGGETVVVLATFGWGTAFNSENPYYYFNKEAWSSTKQSEAQKKLGELYTLLGGSSDTADTGNLTYKFRFTANAPASN